MSIFAKIIKGEIPCHKIAENDDFFSFLDINPLTEGHTLVVPKKEIDYIFDLDDETFVGLSLFSKKIAKAIKRSITCQRVGMSVIGTEVPHAHIHLIPIQTIEDMNFSNPKLSLSSSQFDEITQRIRENLRD